MGQNGFISFPVIPPGTPRGPLPALDLLTAFPPSGLDGHITVACKGDFVEGLIAIEGSPDGVVWDVLGQFSAGNDADSVSGPPVEFSPITLDDVVRFVRQNVQTNKIRGPVVMTLGAEVECDCATGPVALTCCSNCAPPAGGEPDPENFCTDFNGSLLPFVLDTANPVGGSSLTLGVSELDFAYVADPGPSLLQISAPGPTVIATEDGFCFCVTLSQSESRVGQPGLSGIAAGLGNILPTTGGSLAVATFVGGAPTATYQITAFDGVITTAFDTGVPIDGTKHKFKVCKGPGVLGPLTLSIDDAAPIPVVGLSLPSDTTIPTVLFGATVASDPFSAVVDSFCAARNLLVDLLKFSGRLFFSNA